MSICVRPYGSAGAGRIGLRLDELLYMTTAQQVGLQRESPGGGAAMSNDWSRIAATASRSAKGRTVRWSEIAPPRAVGPP
jgi:hypothetical protein